MKKDIVQPEVKDVHIAIVSETNEMGGHEWIAYLVNKTEMLLEGVLISTRGYGEIDGEEKKTATFRHSLEEVNPKSFKKIESLPEELFAISNEFWLSFYINKKMYDKKYIFLPESVSDFNSIQIPLVKKNGVMI